MPEDVDGAVRREVQGRLSVLGKLRDEPMRWTTLMKTILRESPTPWRALCILDWLRRRGYVERPERGVYRITEMGLRLLDTL